MSDSALTAEPRRFFLDRFALSEHQLEETIGNAIARKADYADLYFELSTVEHFALEDGIVKKAAKNVSQGAGVRVVAGEKTGYAHTDEITVDTLRVAARTAQAIAEGNGGARSVVAHAGTHGHNLYDLQHSPLA